MANKIQQRRGSKADMLTLSAGEIVDALELQQVVSIGDEEVTPLE